MSSPRLDAEFVELLVSIEGSCDTLPKHLRHRVERWCHKLAEPCLTVFKRNRNAYALVCDLICCAVV